MVYFKEAIVLFFLLLVQQASSSSIHGCYLSNATNPQQQFHNLNLETYTPHLCSHIFFLYSQIKDDFSLDLVNPGHLKWGAENKFYNQLNKLKSQQPGLKTVLSLGESNDLKEMLINDEKRQIFVQTAANFVKQFEFDGVNVDASQSLNDKAAFTKMIGEFKKTLPEKIIIVSVPSDPEIFDSTWDVPAIAKYSNFFNILEGQSIAKSSNILLDKPVSSTFDSMYKWVSNGLTKNKILVGMIDQENIVNTSKVLIKNQWMKENGFGGTFVWFLDEKNIFTRDPCCYNFTDQEIVDNDLSDTLGSLEECCQGCATRTGCLGWVWDNSQGGTCWFKTTSGPTTTKVGSTAGIFCDNLQKGARKHSNRNKYEL